ncbi:AmmeMemoRadiSam system radical SAM enzyme [Pelovirga terrestris]|uniref:AmmeMemoRadiSam system radical SAM enzyme n=1 Tax=Pelovirga terrestris TaxID=2771352 RepID=A0A8J6QMR9_9BACT|nr:AmmeMemoRadiSam system radical SAM enzyme [Pelovirga terrestris]MBD1400267.1 AmmeMemoRadiSam system radical SAM enzyme [Pelovirga terrestris]
MKEALLYDNRENHQVACRLCAHFCVINCGERGRCGVRENRDGILYSLVYGHTIAHHVDPIEKKPLYHFYPGSRSLSIATPGCNMHCHWCQNAGISQVPRDVKFPVGDAMTPEQIVVAAQQSDSHSIAYTYTEPTIFFEYSLDTARLAHDAGLANVYVSNGYMTAEMLDLVQPYLDAANIDLKSFRDTTYRKYAGARLQPVLDSLKKLHTLGIWLEVTTLIIPGINDDLQELKELAEFIVTELGAATPWHVSRFYPQYQLNHLPSTPSATINQAVEIGRTAGLMHVYAGNLGVDNSTLCPGCGATLIQRRGYDLRNNRIGRESRCPDCGQQIAGVGMGKEEQ